MLAGPQRLARCDSRCLEFGDAYACSGNSTLKESNQPKYRIPQHTREIMKVSMASPHYYIIKNGKGLRSADFIRLWTIPLPPRTDDTIKLVFENFLEMVLCRAFQSRWLFAIWNPGFQFISAETKKGSISLSEIPRRKDTTTRCYSKRDA